MTASEKSPQPATIVLVDDHSLVRAGVKAIIEKDPAFRVVGEAGNASDAFQIVKGKKPVLAVLDYSLPGGNGIAIAKQLLSEIPTLRILILTGYHDMGFVPEAVSIGVLGFVKKEGEQSELLEALHDLCKGKMHLCREAALALAQSVRNVSLKPSNDESALSDREKQVMKLVVGGLRNKEVADQLGISVKSVETYRSRLMNKLGCESTADLVRKAIALGM